MGLSQQMMDLLRSTTSNHNIKKRKKNISLLKRTRRKILKSQRQSQNVVSGMRIYTKTRSAEKSKRLWFPKNTKIVPPKSSNGSSIKLVSDSSFRAAIIRAPKKILFTYSLAGTMVKGEPRVKQRGNLPPAVNRCRHYNLALTRTHKVHFM